MERLERFEKYKEKIVLVAEMVADRIIRECIPMEDEISENQARKAYGIKWLRKMKAEGLAKYARVGGRVLYSRHQLDCLRAAEREQAKLIFKKLGKDK